MTKATYVMKFSVALEGESSKELSSQLAFELNVTPIQGTFNRVFLNYWSDSAEKFYGFGSQVNFPLSSSMNLHDIYQLSDCDAQIQENYFLMIA